jgi:valyl-tRNA synthetase
MSTQLSKTYEPASVEIEALRVWNDEKCFHAEPDAPGNPYSIVIPPPNVTAALHLGHALNNTLQDILTRWHRMLGDNTVWLPGTDHAGIATQTVVDKRLQKEGKPALKDYKLMESRGEPGREQFVAKVQAWKDEYEQTITAQLKRMGCSCDWDRQAFTMDDPRARAVREAFFRLFKDGLIYRGKRLVNWDPATQTALADDEVEMKELDGHFYYLQYPLENGSGHVTVATTRPETMLGDTAVALNPNDPRAPALRGKKVRLPIVNRIIPIIEDDYVVLADPNSEDPKARFATGFLKVTPAHDPNDYDLGRKHDLPMINVMAPDGSISDQHGWSDVGDAEFVLGMDRYEARTAIVEWFRQNKLLENVKPYNHTVGHSYRSHVPIEPYLSDQWYLKVTDDRLAGAALRAMSPDQKENYEVPFSGEAKPNASWQGKLRFYPPRYAKTFQCWHENIRDWCISRQLWWGHRIPVWSLPEGRLADKVSEEQFIKTVQTFMQWQTEGRISIANRAEGPEARSEDIADQSLPFSFVCLRDPNDREIVEKMESLGARQDPDVLDTWFSSGLWPMSTLHWPDESTINNPQSTLNTWNPTSVLCTAREIITLWVSRMVMFNLYFLDRLPYYDIFIHAMIQDGEGRKMSKSLGNGVDPLDIIESHGADAMRFTLCHMTTQTQDVRMPVEKDARTNKNTSPKFDIGRNFCNKMWNAARFVLSNLENTKPGPSGSGSLSLFDRWILSRLSTTIEEVNEALKSYRFDAYAKACYDFFWRDLCDWYVEAIKPAMKDPNRAGQTSTVLAAALDGALRLMHPVLPFITETIFWKLNDVRKDRSIEGIIELKDSPRLIHAAWPKAANAKDADADRIVPQLQEIIGAIRNVRNEHKVDPKRVVSVSIKPAGEIAKHIELNRQIIELLAICSIKALDPKLAAPANAAKAQAAGCEIFVEGMADEAAEQQRVGKRREELKKLKAAMEGRLANESYLAKAPPHLVQQSRDELARITKELESLGG